jgi:hypothetical protein
MKTTNTKKLDQLLEAVLNLEKTGLTRKELTELKKKPLLTNSEFTVLFSISSKTSYNWRKDKIVEFIRISRRVYYRWQSVVELLQSQVSNNVQINK